MSGATSPALRLGYHTSSVVIASVSTLVCLRATYLLLTIDREKLHATILASCCLLPANLVLALTSACTSLAMLSDGDSPGTCQSCCLYQAFEASRPVGRVHACALRPGGCRVRCRGIGMRRCRYSALVPGLLSLTHVVGFTLFHLSLLA